MATTYLVHYAPRANGTALYDPRFFDPRLTPLCKTRGRKDVTPVLEDVTCTACITKTSK